MSYLAKLTILVLGVSLFGSSAAYSQGKKKDSEAEKDRIRSAKIGSVTIYEYSCIDGKRDPRSRKVVEHISYDGNGVMIERQEFSGAYKTVGIYDREGKQITETDYDSTGYSVSKYVYKYNDRGDRIGETSERNRTQYSIKYDERGNKTEEIHFYPERDTIWKRTVRYDALNNAIEETLTTKDDAYFYKWTYDGNGHLIELVILRNGVLDNTRVYYLDKQGTEIERIDSPKYGVFYTVTTLSNGIPLERVTRKAGEPTIKITFTNGNKAEETRYDPPGSPKTVKEYVYAYYTNKSKPKRPTVSKADTTLLSSADRTLERYRKMQFTITSFKIFKHNEYSDATDVTIDFFNGTKKTIKYVNLTLVAYNRVGDVVADMGNKSKNVRAVGPIAAERDGGLTFEYVFYSPVVYCVKVTALKVQYTDGTTKLFSPSRIFDEGVLNKCQ